MARMLQALKNLEARSPRPAAGGGLLAHLAERPKAAELASLQVVSELIEAAQSEAQPIEPARPVRREPLPVLLQSQTVVLESPAAYDAPVSLPVIVTEQLAADLPAAAAAPKPPKQRRHDTFGSRRPPTSLERIMRRTLGDPNRSQPLSQLAHRLARDVEQSGSKSVLWIGIGASSGTHEALLPAAALLSAEQEGETLLIDADVPRRLLTEGLDYGHEAGLAELLKGDVTLRAACRPTAWEKLSVLPAGLLRHADLSTAGPRLEEVFKQLADEFSLVLIDGGRTADLASSTLARLADATYFVVQLGAVEACEAQAALRDFRAAGARVLGCVAT